ncbi:hypothetical protein U9M48_043081, partial [Paspalum notatum var. saurae]
KMLRDEQEDEFLESMIIEGTEEISAQQHEEIDSYLNIENAEAESDGEDNAHPSNEKTLDNIQKNKRPRGPTKKENFEERYTITHVGDDGQPLQLVKAATKFVNYCSIIVRENMPISIPAWKKADRKQAQSEEVVQSEGDHEESVVPQSVPKAQKELLWRELSNKFTLPEGTEQIVKQWTLKKMAILLQTFETKMWAHFVNHGQAPDFEKSSKLRANWELFVQYKESEVAKARSEQHSGISRKRKYNHKMGPGGYRKSIPKWEKMEAELEQRGVNLPTANWPRHSKCWYYGYGGSLSSDGTLIFSDKIKRAAERLVKAIDKSSKGEFVPEREKDELTWALENREHPGRTRGLGNVIWKVGFPEDRGSYRKRRTLSEADAKIRRLEGKLVASQRMWHFFAKYWHKMEEAQQMEEEAQRPVQDQQPSQEAQRPVQDPRPPEDEKRYLVDDLKHHCPCELHIPMWNLSTAVAHGVALPVVPEQKFHCYDIPPGYSTVIMEQVVSGYKDLELDEKGGDNESTLKEVVHGRILWLKAYIKLLPENRDGGTTTAQSTATVGGGSRRPSPPPPKSHANDPPSSLSPPPTKNSKSSK